MKKGRLIYLLGPEGAGKTALANLLVPLLEEKAFKVKIVSIYSNHLLSYLFQILLFRLGIYGLERRSGELVKSIAPYGKLLKLSLYLDLISVVILSLFKVFLFMCLGYVVIAERYVVDTLSNIIYREKWLGKERSKLVKTSLAILLRLIPQKDTIIIQLDCPYNVLLMRYMKRKSSAERADYIGTQRIVNEYVRSLFKGKVPMLCIRTDEVNLHRELDAVLDLVGI